MKKMKMLTVLLLWLHLGTASAQTQPVAVYDVIPMPLSVEASKNSPFLLEEGTPVWCDADDAAMQQNKAFLCEYIRQMANLNVSTPAAKPKGKAIILALDAAVKGEEGYVIEVSPKAILVKGRTASGVFYAIQTLRKSLPIATEATAIAFPSVVIKDAPRFRHRGMMLDCARHFFDVAFVKRYIDLLAMHNMNVFHWHLSDDQGWRIEIKKYPKLAEIASMRPETVVGHNSHVYDGLPHGGYYTQEQIRDVIKYAADRHITVIPEIDMPGHMLAALTAYPELGCTGGPYTLSRRWGVFNDVLCLGKENVYQFCEDVLSEVIDLFPSTFIHIGGDEAPRMRWETCEKCQALAKAQNLTVNTLQSYFTNRIEKYVNSRGRRIIGWDEILEGPINQSATIQSWRGAETGVKAAKAGHDVIMSPTSHCYFDYQQVENAGTNEATLCGGYLPVERVYSLDPVAKLTEEEASHVLGVQANLWTEYVVFPQQADYQVLPRMAALCEVQWCKGERDYQNFLQRLPRLVDLYDYYRYNYATHLFPGRRPLVEGFRPSGD